MVATEPTKPRRVELILRQIDALPTLPAVATRLLSVTSNDESNAKDVIDLVKSDPSLSAKVLALCKAVDQGVGLRGDALTIDRAVVFLGFNAVRNAVLSLKVFEPFDDRPNPADQAAAGDGANEFKDCFDRTGFWWHSLAVAVAAQQIALAHPNESDLPADEAFLAGLLHDLGKLALDYVMPRSFARVVELADQQRGNIAEFERRVIGLDHHTAGKRLAEQWHLPHFLQDCIWLHGSPYETIPRLEHRRLVGLVNLADLVARRQHIGYSGNHQMRTKDEIDAWAERLNLDAESIHRVADGLLEKIEPLAEAMGLDQQPDYDVYVDAIRRANEALGRLNVALDRRSRTAAAQSQVLEGIGRFHAKALPHQSVQDVLDNVVSSACHQFGEGFYSIVSLSREPMQREMDATDQAYPSVHSEEDDARQIAEDFGENHGQWLVCQYTARGEPRDRQVVDAPPFAPELSQMNASQPAGMGLASVLPWLSDYLVDATDIRKVQLLPLPCGWGTAAFLLHDRESLPPWQLLSPLLSTWGAAIASAQQHDGARRLGEELAEANLALATAQDQLTQQESLARLGEMAAGAAHEMNNPLAVISGRSQLLTISLDPSTKEQQAAALIHRESNRLSDLITSLHMFASDPVPNLERLEMSALIDQTVKSLQSELNPREAEHPIYLKVRETIPAVRGDGEHVMSCIMELIKNAIQSNPKSAVEVNATEEPGRGLLIVEVIDDGDGMDENTLDHAMDPFFSMKKAGRRVGMGLARTKRLIEANGGFLGLRSAEGQGTVATLSLPLDRGQVASDDLESKPTNRAGSHRGAAA